MEEQTFFDYYYGGESEQFAFYRIPRQLVTGSYFKNLSTDAKLLYRHRVGRCPAGRPCILPGGFPCRHHRRQG